MRSTSRLKEGGRSEGAGRRAEVGGGSLSRDGAGSLRVLVRVVVPLSAPSIVTVVVVNTVWVWNELLIALVFLQDDNARTLTAGLTFFQGRFQSNEPLVMTGALIATIPMLALYIIGQRFFIRGLSTGFGK